MPSCLQGLVLIALWSVASCFEKEDSAKMAELRPNGEIHTESLMRRVSVHARGDAPRDLGQLNSSQCPAGKKPNSAGVCVMCDANYYSATAFTRRRNYDPNTGEYADQTDTYSPCLSECKRCMPCASGSGSVAGSSQCYNCPVGQYISGVSGCSDCPSGQMSSSSGSTSCTTCPAGKYANPPTRATECLNCTKGMYNSQLGRTACTACERGPFNPGDSSMTANKANSTRYSGSTRATDCLCGPGSRRDTAAGRCNCCETNKYSEYDQTRCCLASELSQCPNALKVASSTPGTCQ